MQLPCDYAMCVCGSTIQITNWYNFGSPDYYNVCANTVLSYPLYSTVPYGAFGYQFPKSGNGFVGIGTYDPQSGSGGDSIHHTCEYVSIKLNSPLKSNTCYYGEFYTSLANISKLATNRIAMYLTQNTFTTSLGCFTNTIQPQIEWDTTKLFTDTLNWVKISGKFIAQGGEQYLTIGNFKDGNHINRVIVTSNFVSPVNIIGTVLAYHYIDDVSLYELPTPQLQSSYTLCPNSDSLVLGDTSKIQTRYQWYANGILLTDTTGQLKIKPIQTTAYVLHTTNCSTTTQTTVVTYSANCEPIVIGEPIIPNVFTPNGDGVNDVFAFKINGTLMDFSVYNRWGNLIQSITSRASVTNLLWDGHTTSGEECSGGVYFYTLEYKDSKGDTQKKNGYVTLLR